MRRDFVALLSIFSMPRCLGSESPSGLSTCQLSEQHRRSAKSKSVLMRPEREMAIKRNDLVPGDCVSIDGANMSIGISKDDFIDLEERRGSVSGVGSSTAEGMDRKQSTKESNPEHGWRLTNRRW